MLIFVNKTFDTFMPVKICYESDKIYKIIQFLHSVYNKTNIFLTEIPCSPSSSGHVLQ